MKKTIAVLTALLLACCVAAAACAEVVQAYAYGFSIDYNADSDVGILGADLDENTMKGIDIIYANMDRLNAVTSEFMAAQEKNDADAMQAAYATFSQAYDECFGIYYHVMILKNDRLDDYKKSAGVDDSWTCLGENCGFTYYYCAAERSALMSEEESAKMDALQAEADHVLSSITFIEMASLDNASGSFNFTSMDLDGNAVTGDILRGADYTVVHVWSTTCSPCIAELSELQQWVDRLPENVQFIGLVADVFSPDDASFAKAKTIMEKTGASFRNIIVTEDLIPFVSAISGTPTTVFFDSEGSTVHDAVVGSGVSRLESAVNEILAK